jgi:MFS transporter, PPP family, 3-phenylpropionic acid transporter
MNDRLIVNDVFARRLALFYAAVFCAYGLHMPFFPLWLEAKGLDAGAIGVVLAAPLLVRLFAIPVGTRLADRSGTLKGALVLAAAVSTVGLAVVGLLEGFAAILIGVVAVTVFSTSFLPLGDAYGLKGLASRGLSYGPVRLWGSVAFIAANLGGGLLVASIAPVHLIWPMVLAFGGIALTAMALAPLAPDPPRSAQEGAGRSHLRAPAFLLVAAAAGLVQASHAAYYGFSTLDWTARGLDGPTIGALWAVGVVAEIVLFAFSARLPHPLGPVALILIGAAGGLVRWLAMAFDPPAAAQVALQVLHALSFGATHLGTMLYLSAAAPEGSRAAAQGDVAVMSALMMAGATLLAGALYGGYGSLAYAAMAGLAGIGGACAVLAWRCETPDRR